MMPHINIANVGGGVHASNTMVMHKSLAKAMCTMLPDYLARRPTRRVYG